MEFIEGNPVKDVLANLSKKKRRSLFYHIGNLIARLHDHNVIHGDLTTSNMILTLNKKIVFLDFGLSGLSKELEKRGVDLHLLKRGLQSLHFLYAKECFNAIIKGYRDYLGKKTTKDVLNKICEIEKRGRYISSDARSLHLNSDIQTAI